MWSYNYTENMYHSDTENSDELTHHGVKGMKWGVRRAKKYEFKESVARESAKEWDELADHVEARGKFKRAAKFRSYAEKDRADAESHRVRAKELRGEVLTPDEAVTSLKTSEAHKRKIMKGVKAAAASVAVIGGAAATARAIGPALFGGQMVFEAFKELASFLPGVYQF